MKKYSIGYTQGVFDMFHVGHLNLLNNAKSYCDYLIVGVNSDDLVQEYKYKVPVIKEKDRLLIVSNIKAVDEALMVHTLDKVQIWNELHYDVIFIGSDWKENPRWKQTKLDLAEYGVDLVFLPYTEGVSSTILRTAEDSAVEE